MLIERKPAPRLKVLNKHNLTHIVYIEIENVIRVRECAFYVI